MEGKRHWAQIADGKETHNVVKEAKSIRAEVPERLAHRFSRQFICSRN
ncbi:MAG: hypothetical protein ACLFN4_03775 [Candidatus Acetothermia bacterium]